METKLFLLLFALVSVRSWPAAAFPVWLDGPPNSGTNTITLAPGWSLIANPLFHLRGTTLRDAIPDNTVGELFKQAPRGTVLLKFDNATQRFTRKNVFQHGRWSNPSETLAPGEGAFLFNPMRRPLAISFTGNWWSGTVSIPAGLSLISSPGPGAINFAPPPPETMPPGPFARNGVNFNPEEGDVVYTCDHASGRFQSHRFNNGGWDVLPSVLVGEACFVYTTNPRLIQYTGPWPR